MKVIGKTGNGFILEASKNEVANLLDLYSSLHQSFKVDVGKEIEISSIYNRYRSFENLIKSEEFKDALRKLNKTVKILTPIEELFTQTKEILK
jgi:hypothetical protein